MPETQNQTPESLTQKEVTTESLQSEFENLQQQIQNKSPEELSSEHSNIDRKLGELITQWEELLTKLDANKTQERAKLVEQINTFRETKQTLANKTAEQLQTSGTEEIKTEVQQVVEQYTIKKWDTLSKLAKAWWTTVNEIQQANQDTVKDVNKIYVGNKLNMVGKNIENTTDEVVAPPETQDTSTWASESAWLAGHNTEHLDTSGDINTENTETPIQTTVQNNEKQNTENEENSSSEANV